MDTTNKYVKMCEDAKEIQKFVKSNHDGTYGSFEDFWGHSIQKDKMVWLPLSSHLMIVP